MFTFTIFCSTFSALEIHYTNLLSVSGKRFLLNSELRLFFVLVFLAFEFFFLALVFNKLNTPRQGSAHQKKTIQTPKTPKQKTIWEEKTKIIFPTRISNALLSFLCRRLTPTAPAGAEEVQPERKKRRRKRGSGKGKKRKVQESTNVLTHLFLFVQHS